MNHQPLPVGGSDGGKEAMVSQATKRAWRRAAAGLFLLPAMAGGGIALWAQGPTPAAIQRPSDKATAQDYLKKGRAALMAGDLDTARRYALAAQKFSGKWEFWQEDTPEKLLGDISTQPGSSTQPLNAVRPAIANDSEAPALRPVGGAEAPKPSINYPTDARQLVKMGREFLKQGKIDLADECAKRAQAIPTRWGLFEYTAEKLASHVAQAKAEHGRGDAEQMLVEARKLYQQGDYDRALELAHNAEQMHGSYGNWEVGDRPSKLIAEIDAAKARQHRSSPAASPPSTLTSDSETDGNGEFAGSLWSRTNPDHASFPLIGNDSGSESACVDGGKPRSRGRESAGRGEVESDRGAEAERAIRPRRGSAGNRSERFCSEGGRPD